MSPPPTVADYMTAVGALLGGIGAVVAGIAACRALNTWRAQLNGQARFEVAKRLLTAAHDFAEQFHGARLLLPMEPELVKVIADQEATPSQRADAYEHRFKARWEPVEASGAIMSGLLPEARALLGPETAEAAEALLRTATTLRTGMSLYVSMVRENRMGSSDASQDPAKRATWEKARKDVYSDDPYSGSPNDNPLTQNFDAQQEKLLKLLRPPVERAGK